MSFLPAVSRDAVVEIVRKIRSWHIAIRGTGEAEHIRDQLAAFLRDELKLELSVEKTLITQARTRAARYLGYEIITQHSDHKITRGRRSINGPIALRVPPDVIKTKCSPYLQHGKPEARTAMRNLDDYDIVATYGAEYQSIVQYYLLATDVWQFTRSPY